MLHDRTAKPPGGKQDRYTENFDRIESEFSIETALDVGGLPETPRPAMWRAKRLSAALLFPREASNR
jgi:hypothetical protein